MTKRQYKVVFKAHNHMSGLTTFLDFAILDFENDGYWFYDEKCSYSDNLMTIVSAIADYGFCKVGDNPETYILSNQIIRIEAYGDVSFKTPESKNTSQNNAQTNDTSGSKRNRRKFYKFPTDESQNKTEPSHTHTFVTNDVTPPQEEQKS